MSTPKAATRKSRTARRARRTAGDSDDEVERLAHSSDSDHSIPNSDTSDSEIISSSDDELDTPAAPATATDHSVSPPSRRTNRKGNGAGRKPATSTSDEPSIVAPSLIPNPTTDWSDLAAQDDGIPTSDPPIVDFGDFVSKGIESIADAGPSQTGRDDIAGPDADEPTPDPAQSGGRGRPKGRGGKTQRQAYLERLSEDPSFTPRVGAFWGHDERLLAPELRGMSEWWRGRWNGRGRGTNARARGRGREGWTNRTERGADAGATEEGSQSLAPQPASSPPPIDRTWGHDGFERMRDHEHPRSSRGGLRGRGRGQARGRGRGGQIGIAREPEQLWTKAPDTHLHIDNSMRPQFPGQGRGIKINLPGRWRSTIVRVAPTTSTPSFPTAPKTTGLDATEIVVKLPGQQAKVVPVATIPQNKPALPEDPVTVLPLQEAPRSVVARLPGAPGNLSQTSTAGSASLRAASAPKAPNMSIPRPISALPAQVLDQQPASTQSGASPKSTLRAPVHGRTRSQLDAVAFAQTAVPISESTPLAFGSLPTLASVTAPPTKHGHIHAQAPAEMAQAPTDIPALAITVPAPVTQALPQPHGVAPYTPPPASAYTPHNPYVYAYTPLDGAAYYSTATPPPPPPPPHQPHMYYPSNTYFVPPRPSGPVSIRAPGESVDENASRAAPAPPMWNYYAHNHYYSPSGTPYPLPPPPRGYYAPPTHGGEYPNSQPSEYTGMYDGYVPGAVYY